MPGTSGGGLGYPARRSLKSGGNYDGAGVQSRIPRRLHAGYGGSACRPEPGSSEGVASSCHACKSTRIGFTPKTAALGLAVTTNTKSGKAKP